MNTTALRASLCAALLSLPLLAGAQEAAIRKNLAERLPDLPKIDEVRKTPMSGLYEVRIGNDLFYTDASGNYMLINGSLLDTKARKDLTEERMTQLTAVDFKRLQTQNAITIVRGNGKRKLAVFEDPNCGYCKRFEKELAKVDNITIYMFLTPILGADSVAKSQKIWCASDKAQAWNDWMQRDVPLTGEGNCNTAALDANVTFAREHRITGTPTLIFADGTRVPGAIGTQDIERQLSAAR